MAGKGQILPFGRGGRQRRPRVGSDDLSSRRWRSSVRSWCGAAQVTTTSPQWPLSAAFSAANVPACPSRVAMGTADRIAARPGHCQDMSADGVDHDDRDLALGLALVVGVGSPEFQRLFPQPCALPAGDGPGPRLDLCDADLQLDLRVREEVAYQPRRCGAPPFEAITK